jgi:hypothetical protein
MTARERNRARVAERVDIELHKLIDKEIAQLLERGNPEACLLDPESADERDDLVGAYRVRRLREMAAWREDVIEKATDTVARMAMEPGAPSYRLN